MADLIALNRPQHRHPHPEPRESCGPTQPVALRPDTVRKSLAPRNAGHRVASSKDWGDFTKLAKAGAFQVPLMFLMLFLWPEEPRILIDCGEGGAVVHKEGVLAMGVEPAL